MRLVFIVFFILLLATVLVIILHQSSSKKLSQFCVNDSDCSSGYSCRTNPEINNKQCLPTDKSFCPITPATQLMKCKLDDPTSCSSKCLNVPTLSCIKVDEKNPYTWKQGDKTVNIPSSPDNYGWCLPDVVNRNVTCNPFTSDYILEEVGENKYQWGCYCKYPNLFDHDPQNPSSDCTIVRACGHTNPIPTGSLYVPKPYDNAYKSCKSDQECESGDKCLSGESPAPCGYKGPNSGYNVLEKDCSKPDSNCVCHTNWLNIPDKIDPISGQCICNEGNDFQCIVNSSDNYSFNCVENTMCSGYEMSNPDKCNPDKAYQDASGKYQCCECPTGYIRCPDDCTNKALVEYCQLNGPICIPDPCNTAKPGDTPNGYWNGQDACVCATGHIQLPDTDNAVGAQCINPCDKFNPCGNRGQCVVINGAAQCTNCVAPFTNDADNSCICSAVIPNVKHNGDDCDADSECPGGTCQGLTISCGERGRCKTVPGKCGGDLPISWPKNPTDKCIPNQSGPIICAQGTTASCPEKSTCCQTSVGAWNCCPFENATCCSDNIHCCPSDHPICDIKAGFCLKDDKNNPDPIPMAKSNN